MAVELVPSKVTVWPPEMIGKLSNRETSRELSTQEKVW
jgi:hypothetical protein